MKKTDTLQHLQTALSMELAALHQYQLDASVLQDWGLDLLATKLREEMMEEVVHSDKYITRIIFLKGEPQMVMAKKPIVAKSLVAMFELDLADEIEAIAVYTESATVADEADDIGTHGLFEKIVMDEEGHKDWLETQLSLIKRMGEPNYIAKHMSAPSPTPPPADA